MSLNSIRDFGLPRGWTPRESYLLIMLGSHYPEFPPSSFYLEQGLRDEANREVAGHYFEQMSGQSRYRERGWAWYCYHLSPNAWRPATSLLKGDSLLNYLNVIYQVLAGKTQA